MGASATAGLSIAPRAVGCNVCQPANRQATGACRRRTSSTKSFASLRPAPVASRNRLIARIVSPRSRASRTPGGTSCMASNATPADLSNRSTFVSIRDRRANRRSIAARRTTRTSTAPAPTRRPTATTSFTPCPFQWPAPRDLARRRHPKHRARRQPQTHAAPKRTSTTPTTSPARQTMRHHEKSVCAMRTTPSWCVRQLSFRHRRKTQGSIVRIARTAVRILPPR